MIYKRLLCILVGLYAVISTAQKQRIQIPHTFSAENDEKVSYAIPNQLNDELVLIAQESKQTKAYLINAAYGLKKVIKTKPITRKFKNIIGYTATDTEYIVFFSNKQNTKFFIQKFDFKNGTATSRPLTLPIKNERYLESINHQNKLHFITNTKGTSELNIHTFTTTQRQTHRIALDTLNSIHSSTIITKIETAIPNVIETTNASNKLYHVDDEIIFSFDHNNIETKLCFINLNTFTARFKNYDKPSKNKEGYRSNSYLLDNKLFQIASSKKEMKFTVTDIVTDTIIKEYAVKKGENITFKNSPIVQQGTTTFYGTSESGAKGIEETAKFLKKIAIGDVGISAYKMGDVYNVLLGANTLIVGVSEYGMPMGGFMPPVMASSRHLVNTHATPSLNPTAFSYSRYTDARSTYINCLLDANFDHTEGKVFDNQFDKIHKLEKQNDQLTAKTIFTHRGKVHFGYFNPKDRTYRLHLFE